MTSYEAFVRVTETGSFTKAAKKHGLYPVGGEPDDKVS